LTALDAAMFVWAKTDANARACVEEVMRLRSNFVRNTFRELGFRGDDLEMRARSFFLCLSAATNHLFFLTTEERIADHEQRLDLLLQGSVE